MIKIVTRWCVGAWLAMFGVWPFFDPGHWPLTLLVVGDLTLHVYGFYLVYYAARDFRREWDDPSKQRRNLW